MSQFRVHVYKRENCCLDLHFSPFRLETIHTEVSLDCQALALLVLISAHLPICLLTRLMSTICLADRCVQHFVLAS